MRVITPIVCSLAVALLGLGTAGAQDSNMSFFITSEGPGDGANLGGLDGADAHCTNLAESAGVAGKTWRAYLSTSAADGGTAVNARDRIGAGPWYNANGVMVAESVDDLHSDNNQLSKENSISESGAVINGRGDSPNMHDIITGTNSNGTAADATCGNWMSNAGDGSAIVGHHDREGGGPDPTSWNASHPSRGCGQADLQGTGGNGLFYCFAID